MNTHTNSLKTCPVTRRRGLPTITRHCLGLALSMGLALLAATFVDTVQADNATPKVYGKTIGNWGHAWWQWAFNFPSAGNPILEDGNVDCSAGQSGEVWYLAGSFGSKAERTCTIKKGKAVFFPLLNGLYWTPLDPTIPEDCTDVLSCRTGVGESIDKITGWSCTVDNVPCVWFAQVVRAQSNARRFNIPPGSVATDFGYAPGVRKISISDGYWVMLNPLPPGEHTIHFTSASAAFPDFALDVTYHLTVSALKD
ncbi:hypothetical protein [Methyloglobulus sp.]|uniref:hypothetical protein n=1 Tax=Methyloglobulus sp. TaxID=2518622 RepID=UPI0032B79DCF